MQIHGSMTCVQRTERIAKLNDRLRKHHAGGQVLMTPGICALPVATIARILIAIRDFDAFTSANDPHGERDMALVVVDDHEVMWKIDAYSVDMESGSPDPADEAVTCRVLSIFLATEY
jgi:hypothetical protein